MKAFNAAQWISLTVTAEPVLPARIVRHDHGSGEMIEHQLRRCLGRVVSVGHDANGLTFIERAGTLDQLENRRDAARAIAQRF